MAITISDQETTSEIEALAVEGLDSGDPIKADPVYWTKKRQRLIDRHSDDPAQ